MNFIYSCLLLICFNGMLQLNGQQDTPATPKLSGTAQLNYFEVYGRCCKLSPNFDSTVPISPPTPDGECHVKNDCDFAGYMACCTSQISLDDVKGTNIVSFYDANADKNWEDWYRNKTIVLTTESGKTFNATIMHTCGDDSCNQCCTKWSNNGNDILIELEYYTAINILGGIDQAKGTIKYDIIDA